MGTFNFCFTTFIFASAIFSIRRLFWSETHDFFDLFCFIFKYNRGKNTLIKWLAPKKLGKKNENFLYPTFSEVASVFTDTWNTLNGTPTRPDWNWTAKNSLTLIPVCNFFSCAFIVIEEKKNISGTRKKKKTENNLISLQRERERERER